MKECLSSGPVMLAKKPDKLLASEMVNYAGRKKYVCGMFRGESVAGQKLAFQLFQVRQTVGLGNQS